jgi:hypothetical protein
VSWHEGSPPCGKDGPHAGRPPLPLRSRARGLPHRPGDPVTSTSGVKLLLRRRMDGAPEVRSDPLSHANEPVRPDRRRLDRATPLGRAGEEAQLEWDRPTHNSRCPGTDDRKDTDHTADHTARRRPVSKPQTRMNPDGASRTRTGDLLGAIRRSSGLKLAWSSFLTVRCRSPHPSPTCCDRFFSPR